MLMKEINDLIRMQDLKQTEYCTVTVTLCMLGYLACCKKFFKIYDKSLSFLHQKCHFKACFWFIHVTEI